MALRRAEGVIFYSLYGFLAVIMVGALYVDINKAPALHSRIQISRNGDADIMTRQIFNTAAIRKHAALFSLAAGVTAGSIVGIGTLLQDNAADTAAQPVATVVTVPPAAAPPVSSGAGRSFTGDVVYVDSQTRMLHVRTHVWVAQFNTVSVCPRGVVAPCQYTADVGGYNGAAPRTGQKVTLQSLAPSGIAGAVQPAATTPAIRPRQDVVAGPVPARVIKTGDGDTVQTEVDIFPGTRVLIDIRIGEIDTPEKGGRAKCDSEAARAEDASAEMRRLLEEKAVMLHNVKYEKYGGRLLADVTTENGVNAAQHMIAKGLAKPYGGGTKESWCTLALRR